MPENQTPLAADALPAGRFRSEIRLAEAGAPPADDMAAINALAHRALDPSEVFSFDCVPSTSELDSYLTKMAPSSLQNYAADAQAGVSLMNSHRTSPWYGGVELPLGRTYQGSVLTDETGQATALQSSGYMLRGYRPNGPANLGTDEVIKGVESGLIFDLSIGFSTSRGGWYRCSICGQDMYQGSCPHYQGLYYDAEGAYQPGKQGRLAFAWVENARLSEVSFVFDGATPGAGIVKAQRAVEAGLLERAVVAQLEDVYQVRLAHRHAVPDLSKIKVGSQPVYVSHYFQAEEDRRAFENALAGKEETVAEAIEVIAAIRQALSEHRVGKKLSAETKQTLAAWADSTKGHGEDLAALATEMADFLAGVESDAEAEQNALAEAQTRIANIDAEAERLVVKLTAAEARAAELAPLADEGRQYRADLTKDTLASGVRALGERFNQELWQRTLGSLPLTDVRALRDQWDQEARERFGPGGKRQTQPAVELEPKAPRTRKNTSQYQA